MKSAATFPGMLPAGCRRQKGIAFVVALVMLVMLTLMGLAGMQNTSLQERLSGNMYDRSLAMQSAEAALRAAEAALSANPGLGVNCLPGNVACDIVPPTAFNGDDGNWVNAPGAFTTNPGTSAGTGQYHIQFVARELSSEDELGLSSSANSLQYGSPSGTPPVNFYRVTARSHAPAAGNDTRSIVVLQSTVRRVAP
ncbi:pilus assembly PilX family protein [Thauera sp. AutoDN2]|uniref:pilus assembly PilX family protein n=1 Tax=Thauera sp. AutoDN2 TaxID=3416051 RepID=UPI003F4C439F